MAARDELIAVWTTGKPANATGDTFAAGDAAGVKIAAINEWTVETGVPLPALVTPSQVIRAIVPADFIALLGSSTQAIFNANLLKLTALSLMLSGTNVDASSGTIRTAFATIFADETNKVNNQSTIQRLLALVDTFDNPQIPWWQSVGFEAPIGTADVALAGLT